MKTQKLISATAISLLISSCGSIKNVTTMMPTSYTEIPLYEYVGAPSESFTNVDKPLRVSTQYPESTTSAHSGSQFKLGPMGKVAYIPDVSQFARNVTENYLEKAGFELSSTADYVLQVLVNDFSYASAGNGKQTYRVSLSYSLLNEAGENVVPSNTANGYVTLPGNTPKGEGLGQAYFSALQKMNWTRIAKVLTVQKSAKKEKNARVEGNGDTALEHTVIRWNITSRPQGADVSWRIVSSTPDVANTNSNYVGTTPYETTESFDIKGLTYNNSGNVQIEITCERPGYLTQKKRFNLRQAIDQKEISAMFNLIKDEE